MVKVFQIGSGSLADWLAGWHSGSSGGMVDEAVWVGNTQKASGILQ